MSKKPAQYGFDARRYLVGGDRPINLSAEPRLGTAAAADQDVITLDFLLFTLFDLCRQQADVPDIVLAQELGQPVRWMLSGWSRSIRASR